MAYLVTVQLLVDDPNLAAACNGVNEALRDVHCDGGHPWRWLVDWNVESVDEIDDSLGDSVGNETYLRGEAFQNWLIFSLSESQKCDGSGYWSTTYGWTSFDLATRFEPTKREFPSSIGDDAVLVLANLVLAKFAREGERLYLAAQEQGRVQ